MGFWTFVIVALVAVGCYIWGHNQRRRDTDPYLDQICRDMEAHLRHDPDAPELAETVGKLRRLINSPY